MQEKYESHIKQPKSAKEIFEAFEKREQLPAGELITFEGVDDKDVYNITAPFVIDGKTYIAGRVESRGTESDSQTRFFEERNNVWIPAQRTPTFDLQDPFVTKVGQELIFGGVKTSGLEKYPKELGYRTEFFRGEHLQALTKFAEGPPQMKDIRLLTLPSGKIAVLTRPQGAIGERGKIGFATLPNLDALATANLLEAKIIEGQFRDDEWGGPNELYLLEDGRIGVLGHIAYADVEGKKPYYKSTKHYYAMAFVLDPRTETASPLRIIATRKNFPLTPSKRSPELDDVIFPGGLIRHSDKTATLYAGLSDTSAGRITIPDPFIKKLGIG